MIATLMPSLCVMLCAGPGARTASTPPWATPPPVGRPSYGRNGPSAGLGHGDVGPAIPFNGEDPASLARTSPALKISSNPSTYATPPSMAANLFGLRRVSSGLQPGKIPHPRRGPEFATFSKWLSINASRGDDPVRGPLDVQLGLEVPTDFKSQSASDIHLGQDPERMGQEFSAFYKCGSIDSPTAAASRAWRCGPGRTRGVGAAQWRHVWVWPASAPATAPTARRWCVARPALA